jgi:hypothetical protein
MSKDNFRKSKNRREARVTLKSQQSKNRKSTVDPTSPLFEGKRLYRQAREGSVELYKRLTQSEPVLADPVRALRARHPKLRVTNTEQLDALIRAAELYLDELCQTVVPYLAIPILLQMTTEFYYGGYNRKPIWLGETLKFAIAKTWKNVHRPPQAENKSLAHPAKVIFRSRTSTSTLWAQANIPDGGRGSFYAERNRLSPFRRSFRKSSNTLTCPTCNVAQQCACSITHYLYCLANPKHQLKLFSEF